MITIRIHKWVLAALAALLAVLVVAGCARPVQETVAERQAALGASVNKVHFLEARQINQIESWKDQPGKVVNWYVEFPPASGNVLNLRCRGVPTSSTESLEPNYGSPANTSYDTFLVPVDGTDIRTNELAGRDGTFGDPIHYRQCFTVDGQYLDIPANGVPYMVSSATYTFAPPTVQRDLETEVRLLQAERLIAAGKCVNPETLVEIPCPEGVNFTPAQVQNPPSPGGPTAPTPAP